ncbi:MAG: S8 family serine peptidase [Oceanipulchritudo sp.]
MKESHLPERILFLLAVSLLPVSMVAGKTVITEADQLPRIAYPFQGDVLELIGDEEALAQYLALARAEIERQLDEFDIQDKATVRGYLNSLRTLDILAGDHDAALGKIIKIREMQDKPADKLTSGLMTEALLEIHVEQGPLEGRELLEAFREQYQAKVRNLPWDLVQDNIESANGMFQYISENLYLGGLESQMQVSVDQNGELTLGDLRSLASIRFMIDHMLPLREAIVTVTGDYIQANRVEKENIWEDRSVDLGGEAELSPVVVAVWDSGVDARIFEKTGQMWLNGKEEENGIDDDDNGFIDDLHGPAWDLNSYKTTGNLYPLSEEELAIYPDQLDLTKGLLDLQAAIDSEEAAATSRKMSNLAREEYKPFIENLSLFGNYTHGTHVAGIIAEGNPAVRILSARITFGHTLIPEAPTIEETMRSVNELDDLMAYLKRANVRVVNMSWGGSQAGLEYALEANGIGDSPEHRAQIARVLFDLLYDALVEAMENNPEILFIPAAGNSDEDVDFNKVIPSSIDLPNVLVVGAVDQAGEETDFTSYGRNIHAHANGFEVPSHVPGGRIMKFSGTSMAAPNVANLAAKLFALDPDLTPGEVVDLIRLGIDVSEDGRRHLINPKKSIALLKVRNSF